MKQLLLCHYVYQWVSVEEFKKGGWGSGGLGNSKGLDMHRLQWRVAYVHNTPPIVPPIAPLKSLWQTRVLWKNPLAKDVQHSEISRAREFVLIIDLEKVTYKKHNVQNLKWRGGERKRRFYLYRRTSCYSVLNIRWRQKRRQGKVEVGGGGRRGR